MAHNSLLELSKTVAAKSESDFLNQSLVAWQPKSDTDNAKTHTVSKKRFNKKTFCSQKLNY